MGIKGFKDIESFIKELDQAGKKQLSFASAKALNDTAKIAQTDMSNHIAANFDVQSGWYLPNRKFGVKKKNATKRNTAVTIFMQRRGKEHWIEDHESGDTRTMQLVPTKYFQRMYTAKHAATKRKAKALLSNKRKNRIFEVNKNGKTYIYQAGILGSIKRRKDFKSSRRTRGRKGKVLNRAAVPIFIVADKAKETPKLGFEVTITKSFEKNFKQIFFNNFNWAMFTGK